MKYYVLNEEMRGERADTVVVILEIIKEDYTMHGAQRERTHPFGKHK